MSPPLDPHADAKQDAERLLQLAADGRLGPELAITSRGKDDGVGAQAIAVLSAMTLARLTGARYRHSPFMVMAHALGDPEIWAQRWEQFLGLGHSELPVPPDAETVALRTLVRDPTAFADRPVVVVEPVYRLPMSVALPVYEQLRGMLRTRYWRNSKTDMALHRGPRGSLTAAVHVRRGDVTSDHPWRYVPDAKILRAIERLQFAAASIGRRLHINLYSEGDEADFRAFATAGCQLHISTDTLEAFHNMVTADILMQAPGNFSQLAGLLSEGIVISVSARPTPLSNMVCRRANGDFSMKRLQRSLLARASWLERRNYDVRRWWRRLCGMGRSS